MKLFVISRFQFLIALVVLCVLNCYAQIIPPSCPNVGVIQYTAADLNSATPVKNLIVNGLAPTPGCLGGTTQSMKQFILEGALSIGDDYNFGTTSFNLNVAVELKLYSTCSGSSGYLGTYTENMVIDQSNPEQRFRIDLTSKYVQLKRVEVKILNNPIIPSLINSVLKLDVYFAPVVLTDVSNVAPSIDGSGSSCSAINNCTANPVIFNWDMCGYSPNYEVEILRLYNIDTNVSFAGNELNVKAEIDWSKALRIETGNSETELKLTLAEGTGYYVWRVRAIGDAWDGGIANDRNWGPWSATPGFTQGAVVTLGSGGMAIPVFGFFYHQFDDDKNWTYSRTFVEGEPNGGSQVRIGEQMQFASGLLQVKQNQVHLQTAQKLLISQQVQDFSGRPSLTTLPAPVSRSNFGYETQFVKDASGGLYTAEDFDANANYNNPSTVKVDATSLLGKYYSDLNPDQSIPNAEGYPYSRTLFFRNGLNQPREQSSPGATHRLGTATPRTVRNSYASVSDIELIRIFGDEAPDAASVYKTVSTDANGTSSISYISKEGAVIATCLSTNPNNTLLDPLASADSAGFPVVDTLEKKLGYNDKGFISSTNLSFTEPTVLDLAYDINVNVYKDSCTNFCRTCDYKVTFMVRNIDSTGFWKDSLIVQPAFQCSDSSRIKTIAPITLPPGDYVVTKKVEAYNFTDTSARRTYLDESDSLLTAQVNADINLSLQTARGFLERGSLDSLYAYWGVSENDSLKILVIGCDTLSVPILHCRQYPCVGNAPDFEQYLLDRQGDSLSVFLPNYSTPGQFNALIHHMLTDPETPYDCQQLWKCWDAAVQSYRYQKMMMESNNKDFDLAEYFLDCAGRKIRDFTSTAHTTGFTTYGYRSHAYAYFSYTPGTKLICEQAVICPNTMNCTPSSGTLHALDTTAMKKLYLCVKNLNSEVTTPNVSSVLVFKQQSEDTCKSYCEARFNDFVSSLIREYEDNHYVIIGRTYTDTIAPWGEIRMMDIYCQARALVDKCKSQCSLTVYYHSGDTTKVDSIGSPAERLAMRQAMSYNYDLALPSCGAAATTALCPCPDGYSHALSSSPYSEAELLEQYLRNSIETFSGTLSSLGGCYNLDSALYKFSGRHIAYPNLEDTLSDCTSMGEEYSASYYFNEHPEQLQCIWSGNGQLDLALQNKAYNSPMRKWNYELQVYSSHLSYSGFINVSLADTAYPDTSRYHHAQVLYGCFTDSLGTGNCDAVCIKWISPELPDDSTVVVIDPPSCKRQTSDYLFALLNAQQTRIVEKYHNVLAQQYKDKCINSATFLDHFVLSYELSYHHYTLYTFNRKKELIKTVPPEGVKHVDGNGNPLVSRLQHPAHTFITEYAYNSVAELQRQKTPDGGESVFKYGRKGQLRFSQNAKQQTNNEYSYTMYNELGMIKEVGVIANPNLSLVDDITYPATGNEKERTITVYSTPKAGASYFGGKQQRFLQNRVSYTIKDEDGILSGPTGPDDQVVTCFSYDPAGNVEWIVRDLPQLGRSYIAYEYDLISGSVLKVKYNENLPDRYFQKYKFDVDKRLLEASTSKDGVIWDRDARYSYQEYGPLKRLVLGEDQVQGLDYIYTLLGWLKGINHSSLLTVNDPAADGSIQGSNAAVAKDVFGMILGYYADDYKRNGSAFNSSNSNTWHLAGNNLYNGNISSWTSNIGFKAVVTPANKHEQLTGSKYEYDELNRLITNDFHYYASNAWNNTNEYDETFSYSPNGNILSLNRNGYASDLAMDQFTYAYTPGTNKLHRVSDAVSGSLYTTDIESGQVTNNYRYDAIGNLIRDSIEGIDSIIWNTYGKVKRVVKSNGEKIRFLYDAMGTRVCKEVEYSSTSPALNTSTYYVTDANGNTMATYQRANVSNGGTSYTANYTLIEQPIYGSDRLGMRKKSILVRSTAFTQGNTPVAAVAPATYQDSWNSMQIPIEEQPNISRSVSLNTLNATAVLSSTMDANKMFAPGSNSSSLEDECGNVILKSYTARYLKKGGQDVCFIYDGSNVLLNGISGIKSRRDGQSMFMLVPGNTGKYYFFSTGADKKAYCYTIDLGQRKVISSQQLGTSSNYGRTMALIEDKTGNHSSKLYLRRYISSTQTNIEVFTITAGGISGPAVVATFASTDAEGAGEIQVSPNGAQMAIANSTSAGVKQSFKAFGEIRIYSLSTDHNTGTFVKTEAMLSNASVKSLAYTQNGSYLYYSASTVVNCAPPCTSPNGVCRYTISSNAHDLNITGYGDVRRGRNGKMYVSVSGANSIAVINTPEATPSAGALALSATNYYLTGGLPQQRLQISYGSSCADGLFTRELDHKVYGIKDQLGNERVIIGDIKLAGTETYVSDDFEGTLSTGGNACSAGNWYMDPGVTTSGIVNSGGSNKLEVYVSGDVFDGVHRSFVTTPGETYKLSFDIEQVSGSLFAEIRNCGGGDAVLQVKYPLATGKVEFVFTAAYSQARIKIATLSNDPTTFRIDNFMVTGNGLTEKTRTSYYADVKSYNNYYAFGSEQPGRCYNSPDYRYGFNGKEKDDEIEGSGASYDFGARMYLAEIGRWLKVDPLEKEYVFISPYSFALNTPVQAKDPDGKVVIFINGMHTGNGGKAAYWGGFDKRAMDKIGDHTARYVDGAMGGAKNTAKNAGIGVMVARALGGGGLAALFGAAIEVFTSSNVNLNTRMAAGEAQGYKDAFSIISNLTEGETIKIVTHSMGGGFGAGYEQGIMNYILENYKGEEQIKMLAKIKPALRVDVSSFQGESIPPVNDDVPSVSITGGLDGGGTNLFKTSPGNSVPTVAPIPGETNATSKSDADKGHAVSELKVDNVPSVGGAGTESKRPIEQGSNNTTAP